MKSFLEFLYEDVSTGTYAGMRPNLPTAEALAEYMNIYNIPNSVPQDKLHTTILYSRKECPDFVPLGRFSPAYIAKPLKLEVWKTRDEKHALVLKLDCPQMIARHNELMTAHGATYDYDSYIPHTTLSYDVGGEFKVEALQMPQFALMFNVEYAEPLNFGWAASLN